MLSPGRGEEKQEHGVFAMEWKIVSKKIFEYGTSVSGFISVQKKFKLISRKTKWCTR